MSRKNELQYYQKKILLEEVILGFDTNSHRFTQDSPVYPGVWIEYFFNSSRVDLLLVPHKDATSYRLLTKLRESLVNYSEKPLEDWQLGNSGDFIAANLSFDELIDVVLPYTKWYRKYLLSDKPDHVKVKRWFERLVYLIKKSHGLQHSVEKMQELFKNRTIPKLKYKKLKKNDEILLWSVNKNRKASVSLNQSVDSIKANASRRVFDVSGRGIRWAILDSGIDAQHPAFCKLENDDDESETGSEGGKNSEPTPGTVDMDVETSRVVETYDFTKFRELFNAIERHRTKRSRSSRASAEEFEILEKATANGRDLLSKTKRREAINYLASSINKERILDWSVICQFLRVPHVEEHYEKPAHSHGTHVAGIMAADMRPYENSGYDDIVGVCPEIELIDIRVIGEDGTGDEFCILAAIQFIRWLNRSNDLPYIQGANMSLSLRHDVSNYACGRTPICDECQRLVAEGTVVVTAAGNQGQTLYYNDRDEKVEGFRTIGITDPGNAADVITVGATHRSKPHTYGVSYFSSRGPTGDGRIKPDLVAPGEKIRSTLPSVGFGSMDGTSMAAPHASGAAALLLAKNRELIGNPKEVKRILCESATDLGRERNFQGHGMLDSLRALQLI